MKHSVGAQEPDISVLVSCYNASRFLSESIASVLAQSYQNFELILIDDGSTDETWNIIQNHNQMDERIIGITKKNSGLADSLNAGIAQARGEWIARLDADDVCEPTRLMTQIHYLRNHPEVVLLGTGFSEMDENGNVIKEHRYPSRHEILVWHLKRVTRFFPHSSAIFKRVTVQDAGCYNPLFRKSQDWDLWLRLIERGRTACLNDSLVRVRKHAHQISKSPSGMSQLVYGVTASTCHFLRIYGQSDPSTGDNETIWHQLMSRVENRLEEEGVLEMHELWNEAREKYLLTEHRLAGGLKFGTHILKSKYAGALLWKKLFGLSLPKKLAQEWIEQPCANS